MSSKFIFIDIILLYLLLSCSVEEQPDSKSDLHINHDEWEIPDIPIDATGSELADILTGLNIDNREKIIYRQIENGNVPEFCKELKPIQINKGTGHSYSLTLFVLSDYLAIGNNEDYLYIPVRPGLAQSIADLWNCSLPTTKIVDEIYTSAPLKLSPHPMTPDKTMVTVPVFLEHTRFIMQQRDSVKHMHPPGTITAGNKKDIVLTNKLSGANLVLKVAIYGWHDKNGIPIQPLYTGHSSNWVDYSHGLRLVSNTAVLNEDTVTLQSIMQHPFQCELVSKEGIMTTLKYVATSYD